MANSVGTYVGVAHRRGYNFLFAGILLVIYELIILLVPSQGGAKAVNLIDNWFNLVLGAIPYGTWVVSLAMLALTVYFVRRDTREGHPIRPVLLGYMWAESLAWALILYFNLSLLTTAFVPNQANAGPMGHVGFVHALGLSFGAGFYEELFFRLLLVSLLVWVFKLVPSGLGRLGKHALIVLITAVLFSLAHHIPPYGEPLALYPIVFRTLFGMAMSVLLLFRGFGITAWTHALYNVLIVISTQLL